MKKYAEDSIGTSDYDTMAKQYGVSKDQAKQIVRQSATLQKLYKKKVGDSSASMPTAPTEPADGNEETASKDYADYIINLAGDEWDSEKALGRTPTAPTLRPSLTMPLLPIAQPISRP